MNKFLVFPLLILFAINCSKDNDGFIKGQLIVKFLDEYREILNIDTINSIVVTNISSVDSLNYKWQVYRIENIFPKSNFPDWDLYYIFYFPETYNVWIVKSDFDFTGVFEYTEPNFIIPFHN